MDLTRSQFLRMFAGAGVGALGLSTLGSCGDSDGKTPDAPMIDAPTIDAPMADAPAASCTARNPSAAIGTNHGHAFAMAVTKEDVVAGQAKTYDIRGASGHPHTITVTAAMFTMLQGNQSVTVTSSLDNNHTHVVTLSCV